MEWARCLELDAMFNNIDFGKASDIMEWLFITAMLKALGLGFFFIKVVEILFVNVAAYPFINQARTENIGLYKLITQGCPLALTLYIMVT
jgi:hypothetical protein